MLKKIFIVEDDVFLQGLEATKLKKEGYDIVTAVNGKEASEVVGKKVKVDLVLLDLLLPDMDGFEVLTVIKKEKSFADTPVIVFSNLSEDKDIKRAKSLGASEFMVKSNFNLDELTEKVKQLIGK